MSKKKKHHKARRIAAICSAWVLAILTELVVAAIPARAAAAFLLPMGYKERGGPGFGGEWIVIMLLFCGTYTAVHYWLCKKLFKGE